MTDGTAAWLERALAARLTGDGRRAFERARESIAGGTDAATFCALLSRASRFSPRRALAPDVDETAAANELGFVAERWTVLEAVRVALVLARPDLESASGAAAVEEAFRFADEGEACALYRSLAHLPGGERFVWRAGEGCRTNMRSVFEAAACDTPYPARWFDATAFRQLAIKAVFIGAPLWRVLGLDQRIDAELARMALDLVDERTSAGRDVPPQLWLALGAHAGGRGLRALERQLAAAAPLARRAAVLALARAGERERLATIAATPGELADVARLALERCEAATFRLLETEPILH